jgi:hypothetical protein
MCHLSSLQQSPLSSRYAAAAAATSPSLVWMKGRERSHKFENEEDQSKYLCT